MPSSRHDAKVGAAPFAIFDVLGMSFCACGNQHAAGVSDACARCGREQAIPPWELKPASESYYKPIHLVNELVTPQVDYETWKEFVDLVYSVQDDFCSTLAEVVLQETQRQHVSPVLGCVPSRALTLATLRTIGPSIIMRLTKQQGVFWCAMVSHFVCARALRAAAMFDDISDALRELDEAPESGKDWPQSAIVHNLDRVALMTCVMQQEVRHTFSGAMPFSIYTLCSGFVSTLLVKNFTFYDDKHLTALTHDEFQDILLALCMGLHPRLGTQSALLPLTADILRLACARLCASQLEKHIIFHTQEQWLY